MLARRAGRRLVPEQQRPATVVTLSVRRLWAPFAIAKRARTQRCGLSPLRTGFRRFVTNHAREGGQTGGRGAARG